MLKFLKRAKKSEAQNPEDQTGYRTGNLIRQKVDESFEKSGNYLNDWQFRINIKLRNTILILIWLAVFSFFVAGLIKAINQL